MSAPPFTALADHPYARVLFLPAPVQPESTSDLPSGGELAPAESETGLTPLQQGLRHAQSYYGHLVRDSTQKQYDSAYKRWEIFCEKSQISPLPADPIHVSACLALTMFETESLSAVSMLRSAIANKHLSNCFPSPTEDLHVTNLFKAFPRLYGEPRSPVDPISLEIVQHMISELYRPEHGRDALLAPLVLWRTVWRTAINFFCLSRFSDLDRIERGSITFGSHPIRHMKIFFVGVKNDLFSEGGEKVISANLTDPKFCPVNLTQHYLQYLGSSYFGSMLPNCDPKNPCRPLSGSRICYSNALKDLKALLSRLGYERLRVREHSAKRGGASHAANSGMSKDDLQRLGGWKSIDMPSRYVDMSLSTRLTLSQTLLKRL
jgi:hypothetical protein